MSRVAILVIASRAPKLLEFFTLQYDRKDLFSFYIHIDRKITFEKFVADRTFPDHVHFFRDRIPVFWGGFSMVEATLLLLEHALKSDASHFVLVSDDSAPLLPQQALYSSIVESKMERIVCWRVPQDHIFTAWYEGYYYMDSLFTNPRWVPTELRQFSDADAQAIAALISLKKRGKFPISALYSGKQWWALSRPVVDRIFNLYQAQQWLVESFRYSAVPDETFFPTILKLVCPDANTSTTPMFDDFSRDPKPYVYDSISQIDLSDKKFQSALFIRKLHPDAVDLACKLLDVTRIEERAV